MSVSYRGQNIKTMKVWYTGFISSGTLSTRAANPISLAVNVANGVQAAGIVGIGSVLCRDPFSWDQGGSRIGTTPGDANPAAIRTGQYEGLDYTQPSTSIFMQHKVVVVEPGLAPVGNPNGGRWVTVIEAADVGAILLSGSIAANAHCGLTVNNSFAVTTMPSTSVAELAAILLNGVGIILEAETGGAGLYQRAAKIGSAGNPQLV